MSDTFFRFTIPGQPPSWNSSYRLRKAIIRDKFGQPVLRDDLKPKTRMGMFKTKDVVEYQDGIQYLVRAARPSGWDPQNQIIIGYQLYLGRMIDSDNVMKAVNDAIAKGLGVNDSRFLPVILHKQAKSPDPRVVIFIFDADFWFPTIARNTGEAELFEPK